MSSLQGGSPLSFLGEQTLKTHELKTGKGPGALLQDLPQLYPHLENRICVHNGILSSVLVLMSVTELEDVIWYML